MSDFNIVVLGSLNIDLVTNSPHLPNAGETITGDSFAMNLGGKGANQAIAVSRLGLPCQMVGRIGNDSFGSTLVQSLQHHQVDTTGILIDESVHTGVAMITVDRAGENHIIVIPEANGNLDETDVQRLRPYLEGANFLLMQLEIPLFVVEAASKLAQTMGVKVILDPAPAQTLPLSLYQQIDIITPNTSEAEKLAGFPITDQQSAQKATQYFQEQGVPTPIITLGSQGVYCASGEERLFIPSFEVDSVIDTVAAGDAFNGALAVALSQGMKLENALTFASAAGALTVTKSGAQSALPTQEAVFKFLRK